MTAPRDKTDKGTSNLTGGYARRLGHHVWGRGGGIRVETKRRGSHVVPSPSFTGHGLRAFRTPDAHRPLGPLPVDVGSVGRRGHVVHTVDAGLHSYTPDRPEPRPIHPHGFEGSESYCPDPLRSGESRDPWWSPSRTSRLGSLTLLKDTYRTLSPYDPTLKKKTRKGP